MDVMLLGGFKYVRSIHLSSIEVLWMRDDRSNKDDCSSAGQV